MAQLAEQWELTRQAVRSDRLSATMPPYRLAASAAANLRQVAELFEQYAVETELVPVDDGSGDGTDEILRHFELSDYRHVVRKPVMCPRNVGKGSGLRAGF